MTIMLACAQLHKQTNKTNGVCNDLYVALLFDSIAFLNKVDVVKILIIIKSRLRMDFGTCAQDKMAL